MRVIAIDWSGDLEAGRKRISLAEVVGRRLVRLEEGRDREAVAEHLLDEARRTPGMIVGLDFAFSLPAWFLRERGLPNVRALWKLAASEGESWLARCEPPFWGRRGRPRPPDLLDEERAFRLTDRAVPSVGGIRPKSVFQIGGAGAVGTGSLRGMRLLDRLAGAGFSIWPFDPPGLPRVVEIYPRVLTGAVNKSSPPERLRRLLAYIETARVEVEPSLLDAAAATADGFDAAMSAFEMARHAEEIAALPPAADPCVLLEGAIWEPGPGRPATAPPLAGTRGPATAASPEAVVRAFVDRINANDATGLADLMAESHVFVDALGRVVAGRQPVRRAWEAFLEDFPGYRIEVSDLLLSGGKVALFGFASGGYRVEGRASAARGWRIPAAWRVVVAGGLVVEWQVYCDTAWVHPPAGENRMGARPGHPL